MPDSSKNKLAFWSLGVATLSLVVVLGTLWWCRCYRIWPKIPVAASPNLIIEDENTASWMTTNNVFAGGSAAEPDTGQARYYWTGVLIQLGTPAESENQYDGVELWNDGVKQEDYAPEDFTWINIVSVNTAATGPPMDTDHAFLLYPNGKPDTDGCALVEDCVAANCNSSALGVHYSKCLRSRKLHGGLDPDGIITYWQGEEGFSFSQDQEVGVNGMSNEQRFTFPEAYDVYVYKANPATWTMTLVEGPLQMDLIRVKFDTGGPGSGTKHDPPWPPGQG